MPRLQGPNCWQCGRACTRVARPDTNVRQKQRMLSRCFYRDLMRMHCLGSGFHSRNPRCCLGLWNILYVSLQKSLMHDNSSPPLLSVLRVNAHVKVLGCDFHLPHAILNNMTSTRNGEVWRMHAWASCVALALLSWKRDVAHISICFALTF